MFDINVKGVFFTVQKALPLLNDGASIIINSSVANQKGVANASVYAATKAAVRSFARTMSAELLARNIRVNVVSPGPIKTAIFKRDNLSEEAQNEIDKFLVSLVPMKRFGTLEEIANSVLFLATPDSSYITGLDLLVDGGIGQL
jgi:NAD(P)-dependent dehydrogenase (short-subunit alcohol dehydrogenase family)